MRLFWELTKLSFQRQFTYRAATLAGLITNLFFGLLRVSVLLALYGERQEVAGISVAGVITYTALSQAAIAFLTMFSWLEVMHSVYTGDVGSDLLKPMDYFTFWMAQDLGRSLTNLLTRSLTVMVAYALAFGITLPHTAGRWLALGAALALAWLVSFAWRFLTNLTAFWTPDARGIIRLGFILAWFFSGFLFPLRFFPDWFVRLAYLTPFPHTVNTIVEVYLGVISGPALLRALLSQLLWALLLVGASRLVLCAGLKRLVVQGG